MHIFLNLFHRFPYAVFFFAHLPYYDHYEANIAPVRVRNVKTLGGGRGGGGVVAGMRRTDTALFKTMMLWVSNNAAAGCVVL